MRGKRGSGIWVRREKRKIGREERAVVMNEIQGEMGG